METELIDWERIRKSDEDPSRTAVMVAPYRTFVHYAATYFEPFGVVETTRSGHTSGCSCIVIQFKHATHAMDLIAKRCILIENIAFKVVPFRSNEEFTQIVEHITFTHPPYYAPPQPDRSENKILNVLNDDCLGEIISRADQSDRSQIEKVCARFKRVAEKAFISLYKRNTIDFTKLNPDGKVTLTEIEKFLYRFWPSIVSVDLSDNNDKHIAEKFNSILKLMAKYCPNLRRLYLSFSYRNNREIENETLIEIRPLLSKLNSLSIRHTLLSVCNAFIAACVEIETLSVYYSEADSVLPEINFSKLKSCSFPVVNSNMLDGFLSQNPQIDKINLQYDFNALRSISEKVPNIRELDIKGVSTRLTSLESFHIKSMKQTKISMRCENYEFLAGNSAENLFQCKNITGLYLPFKNGIDFNVIIELAKHLCNLEALEINLHFGKHIPSKDQLKVMLSYAMKLTKLELRSIFHEFCEKDYNEILEIVKSRSKHPLKLNIESSNYRTLGDKRKQIFFNTNPQWLTITNVYQFS